MTLSAAGVWAERARAELGASERFRELAQRLISVGAPPRILDRVAQAEKDEERHAGLCAQMALKLGHSSGFASSKVATKQAQYSWHALGDEADRLLLDVVLMCCLTESMNASLLNSIYADGQDGEARELIRQILADEVKHAQIGWAYLGLCAAERDCRFVGRYLAEMLDITVRDELFVSVENAEETETYAFGVMPLDHRLVQFLTTLDEVVQPGFEHFGIDTGRLSQWRDDKLRTLEDAQRKKQVKDVTP